MSVPVWVYSAKNPNKAVNGLLVDLSESGAKICTMPHDCPEDLLINWAPVPGLEPIILRAQRKWAEQDFWGVHFKELSAQQKAVIKAMLRFRGQ